MIVKNLKKREMIQRLTKHDHGQLFSFLQKELSFNLFIIGDIELFGYDADFQEIWGELDETGGLKAVLLRYYNSFIPYAQGDFDVEGFAVLIQQTNNSSFMLSGKSAIVERFEQWLQLKNKRVMYFCECDTDEYANEMDHSIEIKEATLEDVDCIIELRRRIAEFAVGPNAREMLAKGMEAKTARTYYIEKDGNMVASTPTTAENSLSAMIVGVCTDERHRQIGYASAIVAKLIRDLLSEGKTLCLFYDNPKAGSIYKRLVFAISVHGRCISRKGGLT
jgi:uncharacterized protein